MVLSHEFCLIPQRYILAIMGLLAIVNAYTTRIALSVAITEMVMPSLNSTDNPDACPVTYTGPEKNRTHLHTSKLYDWDESTQGLILSSFFLGYILTHVPGGVLAEKFGGKYSLGIGILITSVFTFITPFFVDYGFGWLVVLRVLVGFGQGSTFPALNALLGKWVPYHERARLGTLVYSGAQIGTIVGNSVSGVLIDATKDWATVFYFFGGAGIVWFILFSLLCYSDPEEHPFISDAEKEYLRKELVTISNKGKKIPWKPILTSLPLWALVFAQIGHDFGFFAMVTDLPKYMSGVLKFDVKESGLWSSLPHMLMWIVSMLSSCLCDWLIKNKYMDITFARRLFTTLGAVGPGIFMLGASYAGCDSTAVIAMFTLAMGTMGTYYCGMKINALDLAPNYAGTLMAIVNGIGAISGVVAPYLIGALTEEQTVNKWRTVFWITMAIFVITSIIYVFYGSGEEQWWNTPGHTNFSKKVDEAPVESKKIEKDLESENGSTRL